MIRHPASTPRYSRLTLCVGVVHLVLLLLGPLAHDHVDRSGSDGESARIHHAHALASDAGAAELPAGQASLPDGGASDTDHVLANDDDLNDLVLQPRRSVAARNPAAAPMAATTICHEMTSRPRPGALIGFADMGPPVVPASSGALALHQGTDVSPPRA